MNLNRVLLAGNVTRDIELRHTPNGNAVAQIGLAVNERYKSGDEWKESVVFIDCEAWGKTAENVAKFFGKGKPIFIEGRLKLDTWKDKTDGSNRSKMKVTVESFQFVGGKGEGESPRATSTAAALHKTPRPVQQNIEPIDEESIPF